VSLQELLRGVGHEIRRDNGGGQIDPGYQFCHDGVLMCERCPVDHNRKACRLTEDERLDRWIVWQVRQVMEDPAKWADSAMYQVKQLDPNPGMLLFMVFALDVIAQEPGNEVMAQLDPYLDRALRIMRGDQLLHLAEQARRLHEASPNNRAWADTCEAYERILGHMETRLEPPEPREPLLFVDGVCMNPPSGHPTSEWPRPQ